MDFSMRFVSAINNKPAHNVQIRVNQDCRAERPRSQMLSKPTLNKITPNQTTAMADG
jgi:hypothetical protein